MMAEKIFEITSSPEATQEIVGKARKKAESFAWECVSELWRGVFTSAESHKIR